MAATIRSSEPADAANRPRRRTGANAVGLNPTVHCAMDAVHRAGVRLAAPRAGAAVGEARQSARLAPVPMR